MTVRYLVEDVDVAIGFYTGALGFVLDRQFGSAMAIVSQGSLSLWLAGPSSSAAKTLVGWGKPVPGGWNRFVMEVEDLSSLGASLRAKGVRFRGELVSGPMGLQLLCEDPSGNLIELYQAIAKQG